MNGPWSCLMVVFFIAGVYAGMGLLIAVLTAPPVSERTGPLYNTGLIIAVTVAVVIFLLLLNFIIEGYKKAKGKE